MTETDERFDAHEKLHEQEREAARIALANAALLGVAHDKAHDAQHESHEKVHSDEQLAIRLALAGVQKQRDEHAEAHEKEHIDHTHVHENERKGVFTALEAVGRERDIHAAAHEKEHEGHKREHELDKLAILKVESTTETRFQGVNEFRAQLSDQSKTFAPIASVDAMRRELERRIEDVSKLVIDKYEDNRKRIENIEKGDVAQTGKGIGQGNVVGWIVAGAAFVATVLGIVVVLANLVTSR